MVHKHLFVSAILYFYFVNVAPTCFDFNHANLKLKLDYHNVSYETFTYETLHNFYFAHWWYDLTISSIISSLSIIIHFHIKHISYHCYFIMPKKCN